MQNVYICPNKQSMELLKLKEVRLMRKISIKEVSKITGINRDRISLIERGIVNPSFDTVVKIADALKVELIFILR